jgi:transposase-like protein
MVAETLAPGVSVVARRHDVNANQLFRWRREWREGLLGDRRLASGWCRSRLRIEGSRRHRPGRSRSSLWAAAGSGCATQLRRRRCVRRPSRRFTLSRAYLGPTGETIARSDPLSVADARRIANTGGDQRSSRGAK